MPAKFKDLTVGSIFYFLWPKNGSGSFTVVNGIKCESTRWKKYSTWQIEPVNGNKEPTGGQKWDVGFTKAEQPIYAVYKA